MEKIEQDRLLEIAKRDYPLGTLYYEINPADGAIGEDRITSRRAAKWLMSEDKPYGIEVGRGYIYSVEHNKWAPLVHPKPKPEVITKYNIY